MLIEIKPTPMTVDVMKDLEQRGLIIRLCPGNHVLNPGHNESLSQPVYVSNPENGAHKLIAVYINALDVMKYFGTHVDNEEFLFIGNPDSKPLYLAVALCKRKALEEKIKNHSLAADDFIALRIRYNNPEVSFFTMLAGVAHGEVTVDSPSDPGSFYVTEPNDLTIDALDFDNYKIRVKTES